ncbi:unnamed protein product [Amoebophrya sp. A120]|nr:unnamed protein product [Amoebophrya sp. A120]|eukprot:GSA120T00005754001.1
MSLYRPPIAHATGELWVSEPGMVDLDYDLAETYADFCNRYQWRFPFLDAMERKRILAAIQERPYYPALELQSEVDVGSEQETSSAIAPVLEPGHPVRTQWTMTEGMMLKLTHWLLKRMHPRYLPKILNRLQKSAWPPHLLSGEGLAACISFFGGYESCAWRFLQQSNFTYDTAEKSIVHAFRFRLEKLPDIVRNQQLADRKGSRVLEVHEKGLLPMLGITFHQYHSAEDFYEYIAEARNGCLKDGDTTSKRFGTDFVLPQSPFGGEAHQFLRDSARELDQSEVPDLDLYLAAGELANGEAILDRKEGVSSATESSSSVQSTAENSTKKTDDTTSNSAGSWFRSMFGVVGTGGSKNTNSAPEESDEFQEPETIGENADLTQYDEELLREAAAEEELREKQEAASLLDEGNLEDHNSWVNDAESAASSATTSAADLVSTTADGESVSTSPPTHFPCKHCVLNCYGQPVEYWPLGKFDFRALYKSFKSAEVDNAWLLSLEAKDRLCRAAGKSGLILILDCSGVKTWKTVTDMYYIRQFVSLVSRVGEAVYAGQVVQTYIINVPEALYKGPGKMAMALLSQHTNDKAKIFYPGDPKLPTEVLDVLPSFIGPQGNTKASSGKK